LPNKTVYMINNNKGTYIVGLKSYQKKLLTTVQSIIKDSIVLEEVKTSEIYKGRSEERQNMLYINFRR
jgi:hypothetical protein